jgi:hypothetical protein
MLSRYPASAELPPKGEIQIFDKTIIAPTNVVIARLLVSREAMVSLFAYLQTPGMQKEAYFCGHMWTFRCGHKWGSSANVCTNRHGAKALRPMVGAETHSSRREILLPTVGQCN